MSQNNKNLITVILGAGVSKNYGFPLGSELITGVRNSLPTAIDHIYQGKFAQVMHSMAGGTISKLNIVERGVILRRHMNMPIKSIDSYINKFSDPEKEKVEEYSEYTQILKSLITLEISEIEANTISIASDGNSGIYSYIFKRLFLNR